MSQFFFFIVIIIIISNVISSIGKNAKKGGAKRRAKWNGSQSNQNQGTQTGRSMAQTQMAKEAARRIQDRIDARSNNRRDPADNNRHRVTGWGERSGDGFFSLKNVFILIVLGLLVLYILSVVPADFGSR